MGFFTTEGGQPVVEEAAGSLEDMVIWEEGGCQPLRGGQPGVGGRVGVNH